jgi:putative copper export protein
MHILGVTVWLGGLIFQEMTLRRPRERKEDRLLSGFRNPGTQFTGMMTFAATLIAVTGIILMVSSPRFSGLHINDNWSLFLTLKELVFGLMAFFAFAYSRMATYLERPVSNGGFDQRAEFYRKRVHHFRRIGIALGITALLLSSGMNISG